MLPNTQIHGLHRNLAMHMAKLLAEDGLAPYQVVIGAPGTGKTTFLRLVAYELRDAKKTQFVSVSDLMQILSRGAKQEQCVYLVDKFDEHFTGECETTLRQFFSGIEFGEVSRISIVGASTTPVFSGEINYAPLVEGQSRKLGTEAFFYGSIATMPFMKVQLAPEWESYTSCIRGLFRKIFSVEDQSTLDKLAQSVLLFTGPFPPCIRAFVEHILLKRMTGEQVSAVLQDLGAAKSLAQRILLGGCDQSVSSALDWVLRWMPQAVPQLQAHLAGEAPSPRLLDYMERACLAWGSHSALSGEAKLGFGTIVEHGFPEIVARRLPTNAISVVAVLPQSDARLAIEAAGPAIAPPRKVTFAANKNTDGGRLAVFAGSEQVGDGIELSKLEWTVFRAMTENSFNAIAAMAESLKPVNESQVRSALHRLIDKLTEAGYPWVIENSPRRGYMLRLTEPPPKN